MIKGKLINGDARLMVFFAGAEDKKKTIKTIYRESCRSSATYDLWLKAES